MNFSKTTPLYLTRFIAAYLVLIYHYAPDTLRLMIPGTSNFDEPVNYFFFLSGFVMIVSSKKCLQFNTGLLNFSKSDFWIKRAARIYPMYILALLLFVIYNYAVKEIDPSIPKRIWLEILGIQRWFYKGSVNFPDWTVSCEFFFYFLFPFTLPWMVKRTFKHTAIVIFMLFLVNVLFTIFFDKYLPKLYSFNHSNAYKLLLDAVLLHPLFKYTVFLAGCLCGRYYLTSGKMKVITKYSSYIFLLSLCIITAFYKSSIVNHITLSAGILTLVYFPFVLSACSFSGKILQFLSWQPFVFLGEISYGIYIMQAPAEHYFEYLFTGNKHLTTNLQFFSYTLFLISICAFLYYLYEIPAKNFIINFYKKKSSKNVLSALIA